MVLAATYQYPGNIQRPSHQQAVSQQQPAVIQQAVFQPQPAPATSSSNQQQKPTAAAGSSDQQQQPATATNSSEKHRFWNNSVSRNFMTLCMRKVSQFSGEIFFSQSTEKFRRSDLVEYSPVNCFRML